MAEDLQQERNNSQADDDCVMGRTIVPDMLYTINKCSYVSGVTHPISDSVNYTDAEHIAIAPDSLISYRLQILRGFTQDLPVNCFSQMTAHTFQACLSIVTSCTHIYTNKKQMSHYGCLLYSTLVVSIHIVNPTLYVTLVCCL